MSMESFNPSYPNPEQIKKAEDHLTPVQRHYTNPEDLDYLEGRDYVPRQESIESISRFGELAGLDKEQIEKAIRTSSREDKVDGVKISFTLKNKQVEFTLGKNKYFNIVGIKINGRELSKDQIHRTDVLYHKVFYELNLMLSEQDKQTHHVKFEHQEYEEDQQRILEKDLLELGI